MISRRAFIPALGAVCIGASLPIKLDLPIHQEKRAAIKPNRLFANDLIAVCAPAGPLRDTSHADVFKNKLQSLGFRVVLGKNVKTTHGFFTATDQERADELMDFVRNPEVKAIVCMKGGWGCARILDKLDYELIRKNPKVIMGFSDITSLINAITMYSGLVTYHGPSGNSTWNDFSLEYIRKVLVHAEKVIYKKGPSTDDVITTHSPGIAEGELFGGNLSVLTAMIGTPYFPDPTGKIMFLEEVKEEPFRIDRMIVQLEQAGIIEKLNGIIIGKFRDCVAEEPDFSFTCEEIYKDHFSGLKIPVYSGAMIGHIVNKFTIPIGVRARMNADKGELELLEPSVV